MIRKNLMKSLSVIMAAMMAIMTVACGSNTVENTADTAVEMAAEEEAGEDPLANTVVSASNIASAESEAGKVETVYVTADANGAVNDVIVSEWLKNAAASPEIADTTQLKDIVNVKGDETFTDNGDGTLTWNAAGSDIYYQGTTNKQLPVTMKITYTLDGKEITPEELAGKSGKVTIRFEYENNDKQTVEVNGKEVDVYTPFAMVSGMMLDSDKFTNVEISNGKVISDGGNIIVMGVALPGLKESLDISDDKWDELEDADEIKDRLSNSFEITADTTDFELGMTITMASSDILSDFGMTDLSGSDKLDDLKSDMEDLNDGSNKLVDGTKELKDGTKEFADGTKKLYDGATELKDGTQKLYDGTGSLTDGTSKLASGASALSEGIDQYTDGVSKVNDGAKALADGVKKVKSGTAAFRQGMDDAKLKDNTDVLIGGAGKMSAGLKKVNDVLAKESALMGQQLLSFTAIESWLTNQGTLAIPTGVSEDVFNACLLNVSGNQIGSVDAANSWMTDKVKPNQEILDDVYANASKATNAQTLLTTFTAVPGDFDEADLLSGLEGDEATLGDDASEDGETAVSVTTETSIPAGDDVVVEADTNTVINPEEDKEKTEEDKEETKEETKEESKETSTEETKPVEPKQSEVVEEKTEQKTAETDDKKDETADQDDVEDDDLETVTYNLEDDDLNVNSTKSMIVKKEILTTSLAATHSATEVQIAKTVMQGYYKMCGSASAFKGATQESIKMFTAKDPVTKKNFIEALAGLYDGAVQLEAGSKKFQSGVLTLYNGALALEDGAGTLSDGADKLASGTKELASNSDKLRDGASQLADGANQLNDGAVELRDGAGKLNDGTGELKDGTKELYDGSIELDNGVKELLDGVTKFDEEGIKKIYEAFDGDLSDFTDRLEAIKEAGSSYKTFGGSADDVDSSVKFIIKTDSIKSL